MNENSRTVSELFGSVPAHCKVRTPVNTVLERSLRVLQDSLRAIAHDERRSHPRVATDARVKVDVYPPHLHDSACELYRRVDMHLVDLSVTGAGLRTSDRDIDVGDRVVVRLPYPRRETIVLSSRVIRIGTDAMGVSLGVRFESMSRQSAAQLESLLAFLQGRAV